MGTTVQVRRAGPVTEITRDKARANAVDAAMSQAQRREKRDAHAHANPGPSRTANTFPWASGNGRAIIPTPMQLFCLVALGAKLAVLRSNSYNR